MGRMLALPQGAPLTGACLDEGMAWEEGCEMRFDANGTYTWSASTVRDAERFVKVQMAHVRSNFARRA